MEQKRSFVGPLVVLAIVVVVGLFLVSAYNSLVTLGQAVDAQWGQVQNVYQRRADLIPNLVATVKGAAGFESSTYEAVAKARASVGQIPPRRGAERGQQSARLRASTRRRKTRSARRCRGCWRWSRTIRSSRRRANFQRCKRSSKAPRTASPLSGRNITMTARAFNTKRDTIPTVWVAGIFGSRFNEKPYFQAQAGAEKAPTVNFSP